MRIPPRFRALLASSAFLATGALANVAAAGNSETHDGLFLRLAGGIGGIATTAESGGTKQTLSGAGIPLDFAIGGSITRSFALHADFYGTAAVAPKLTVNENDLGKASDNTTLYGNGVGLGATLYTMPFNLYFSGSVGVARYSIKYDNGSRSSSGSTKAGLGVNLLLGKEWWITDNWGLGVAANVTFISAKDSDNSDVRWNGASGGILLSATYN
jgi:hypothetical protein